ncbi:MAG: PEP-CTERM sorting domain-containing protein, partial [Planctomycetales bacterium]|nr:PEP-CTERM sorting domain-containing protein [Planctomycetales bacterium]
MKHSISKIALTLGALLCVAAPSLAQNVFTNVPEASAENYIELYRLSIPTAAGFNGAAVPYAVDNSGQTIFYDRVAYYLELDSTYAYASMDRFDSNPNLTRLGLPNSTTNPVHFRQIVNNLNVVSNSGSVTNGTAIATGNIEMWPSNYNGSNAQGIPGASGSTFDFGDGNSGTGNGYGSFQVHNYGAAQTILAYNRWGGSNGNDDIGIGNSPTGNPDYTFRQNTADYGSRNLQILVRPKQLDLAPANITSVAPEASTFSVVYELPVANANFSPSQYAVDNSSYFPNGSFDRLAYYLELDNGSGLQYAFVSMDPFTGQASLTGVPQGGTFFETGVTDVNVVSNVAGVDNGTGFAGNIEFWPTNYSTGANSGIGGNGGTYDFDDTRSGGGNHGSFQIHNTTVGETIIAFNSWNNGGNVGIGIGNQPTGNPDWTFTELGGTFSVKNIWVLANVAGANLDASAVSGPTIDFGEVDGTAITTLLDEITLQNSGVMNSVVSINGFTLTGADPTAFDVSDFAPFLLQGFFDDTVLFDVSFLGGAPGDYSALLTFNTSSGDVSFNLSATAAPVPEPASVVIWSLLGLGLVGFGCRRARRSR